MRSTRPTPSQLAQHLFQDSESLAELRKELLRFAFLQLRNSELAEDVVQEALAAAVAAQDQFEQRASVKTWVFSILKNKIIDVMRDSWHKKRIEIISEEEQGDFDALFNEKDHWQKHELSSAWGRP